MDTSHDSVSVEFHVRPALSLCFRSSGTFARCLRAGPSVWGEIRHAWPHFSWHLQFLPVAEFLPQLFHPDSARFRRSLIRSSGIVKLAVTSAAAAQADVDTRRSGS